jgi:hypothetical protein
MPSVKVPSQKVFLTAATAAIRCRRRSAMASLTARRARGEVN